jgi:hypothetical protein
MTFWEKTKIVFSQIWDFLAPFVKIFLSEAGQILAASAIKAVTSVAATMNDADGDTKRKAAFDLIKAELISQGVTLGTSMINAAIEAAVQKLKDSQ